MKIAVQGCAHGELENIYNTIEYIEKQNNITIDLLLCCGDFQATRNLEDLKTMAVPPKFRSLCTFYKYYSGEKLAPKLTIFIGGNHEASNYLQELPYGGWVAPNIYYLGYAGVVNVRGIRIAGLSGIFKGWDFPKGRYEKPPYNNESIRSCYHIRNLDVFRLKQLSPQVNIMMSHDWPAGITNHGNVQQLLQKKPFFKEDIENDSLGSKPAGELLEHMKPDYWFAAHLHVKFAALVKHKSETDPKTTKFLSLDKCLPRRRFLQIVDVPEKSEEQIELKYDLEWLTILCLTNHLLSIKKLNSYMPGPSSNERWIFTPTQEEMNAVLDKFQNNLTIPKNFTPTAPAHDPNSKFKDNNSPVHVKINPQTVQFCEKLGVDDPIALLLNEDGFHNNSSINLSNLESSSFIGMSDSELENSEVGSRSFKRTPLKLPQPSYQVSSDLPEDDDDVCTSTPQPKDAQEGMPLSESRGTPFADGNSQDNTNAEEKKDEGGAPGPKKFRRRNVALYTSTEDDEDT